MKHLLGLFKFCAFLWRMFIENKVIFVLKHAYE